MNPRMFDRLLKNISYRVIPTTVPPREYNLNVENIIIFSDHTSRLIDYQRQLNDSFSFNQLVDLVNGHTAILSDEYDFSDIVNVNGEWVRSLANQIAFSAGGILIVDSGTRVPIADGSTQFTPIPNIPHWQCLDVDTSSYIDGGSNTPGTKVDEIIFSGNNVTKIILSILAQRSTGNFLSAGIKDLTAQMGLGIPSGTTTPVSLTFDIPPTNNPVVLLQSISRADGDIGRIFSLTTTMEESYAF